MATVWRKKTVRWTFDGRQVTKATPGSKPLTAESKRWYGSVKLPDGRTKQTPLCEDRAASLKLLRRLQTAADNDRALGITPKDRERQRPLSEHLGDYETHLRSKGNVARHVSGTIGRIKALLDATQARTAAELDAGKIAATLARWRVQGAPSARQGRKPTPIGVGTSNGYTRATKGFSRWLWIEGKVPDDPLRSLRLLNAKADRRCVRRALADDELRRLLAATRDGKTIIGKGWRMPADDRAWLYTLATHSGLRAGELASLTRESFDFDARTVTVPSRRIPNVGVTTRCRFTARSWMACGRGSATGRAASGRGHGPIRRRAS